MHARFGLEERVRLLFYVQHLLGIGHVRRAALLAEALTARGVEVCVVSGGMPVDGIGFDAATQVRQLPPVRARDVTFQTLIDRNGDPVTPDLWAERRRQLLAIFRAMRPHAVLIESYPFGRRAFRGELDALLETAHEEPDRPLIASSVRDVLVEKRDPTRLDHIVAKVQRYFDLVLVHGDPTLIPFDRTFPAAPRLGQRLRYTGYVTGSSSAKIEDRAADGADEVLVSVGGGAVGGPLLRTALAARSRTPVADTRWRVLLGPDLPVEERAALRSLAAPGVIVESARRDFPNLLQRCRLSISQAGYNTVMDILQAGCRAVVIPFAAGQEGEQTLRARMLEERGLLTVVAEDTMSPRTLADGIKRELARVPSDRPTVAMNGATTSAALLTAGIDGKTLGM